MAAIVLSDSGLGVNAQADTNLTYPGFSSVAIDAGEAVAWDGTTGKLVLADAGTGGNNGFRGLAVNDAAADQPVSVLKCGWTDAFDVSGMSYDDPIYLSDTSGGLDTTAGTVSIVVGRVGRLHGEKLAYIENNWD